MRAVSILFLVMNVYYFCYPYFLSMNLNIGVVDKILLNFQQDTGLFSHSLVSKSFSLLFLFFSLMGAKGKKRCGDVMKKYRLLSHRRITALFRK